MNCKDLWAKSDPYHPLWCHLLDIAAVWEALLPRFNTANPLPIPEAWLLYIVAMHDIGKADAEFQNKEPALAARLREQGYLLADEVTGFRHEARSAEWLYDSLLNECGWGEEAATVVCQAIRGHHGNFQAEACSEEDFPKRQQFWARLRSELHTLVNGILQLQPFQIDAFDAANSSVVGLRLSGLIVLSDWIASNHELYRYAAKAGVLNAAFEPADYFAAARREAKRAVERLALDFFSTAEVLPALPFRSVWTGTEFQELRPSQSALEQACMQGLPSGLVILEAPMGEGKTEGAIYISENWNLTASRSGAYIALPTMATSNQMHTRYKRFMEVQHPGLPAPSLIHGMAWLLDEATPTTAPEVYDDSSVRHPHSADALDWFRNAKRALIAPDGVGTVDQALMAALHVKHGFLRLFGLSARTLIIDEVHAYDEYMTVIIENLLIWCRALKIPVILLSATLSHRQKSRLITAYGGKALPTFQEEDYPLVTIVPLTGETYTIPIERSKQNHITQLRHHAGLLEDVPATARLAVETVREGGCVCVLANTVRAAQQIFDALPAYVSSDTQLLLFHARFRAEQRQEIEQKVVALFGKATDTHSDPLRPTRAILVCTQVVEQSLDVDFDVMVSQIAPIDLLLQRSGRLHRHSRTRPPGCAQPVLHLLLPSAGEYKQFGGTGYVYAHEPLLRTLALLHDRASFDLPTDFRPLVEGCYSDSPLPSELGEQAEFKEALNKAAQAWKFEMEAARQDAHTYLIPPPDARVFKLAQPYSAPVTESEEGDKASYFRARTRWGDDSRSVLVLHASTLIEAARFEVAPPRNILKKLFLQTVNLPTWWFQNAKEREGTQPFFEGKPWLRRTLVLPMNNGIWQGQREQDGKIIRFIIVDDSTLGITCTQEEE